MATIHHQQEFYTYESGIALGQSRRLTFGPHDKFKTGTVQAYAHPTSQVADTTDVFRTQTLQVQPPKAIVVPVLSPVGTLDFEAYVELTITNVGGFTIRQFWLAITVIGP
jgi:hypothetical protein